MSSSVEATTMAQSSLSQTSFKRISCDGKTFYNMPVIGFGTYKLRGIECQKAVQHALKSGYRSIDTAECYRNFTEIAKAIKWVNIKRKDLFITTKLSPRSMKSQNKMESAIIDSLQSLQCEYIDILLLHWPGVSGKKASDPNQSEHRLIAWSLLEKYVQKGLIRSIGVSNFDNFIQQLGNYSGHTQTE